MKLYPALDVESESDMLLALVDDFSPSAVEARDASTRLFFPTRDARDAACAGLRAAGYRSEPLDVSDEDWARRSQDSLAAVTVGRVTVAPPWAAFSHQLSASSQEASALGSEPSTVSDQRSAIVIVINPSMGFGTGHHETTRLCLEALQTIDLTGVSVLDVGTGSGVLAIAADRLGASNALGIDNDPDAVQSARENLALNPRATRTSFDTADLTVATLPAFDVVTANLTGALLVRAAGTLSGAVRSGGALILSGVLAEERDAVGKAFSGTELLWEREEHEWVGFALKKL